MECCQVAPPPQRRRWLSIFLFWKSNPWSWPGFQRSVKVCSFQNQLISSSGTLLSPPSFCNISCVSHFKSPDVSISVNSCICFPKKSSWLSFLLLFTIDWCVWSQALPSALLKLILPGYSNRDFLGFPVSLKNIYLWVWRLAENFWGWFSPLSSAFPGLNFRTSGLVTDTFTPWVISLA